jgi:hypothetical protein
VVGNVGLEGGNAQLDVTVQKLGAPVTTATVTMTSDIGGQVVLTHQGGGQYTGALAGWGTIYTLDVQSGDDNLHGAVKAPRPAPIISPDPTVAFDAHATPTIDLKWDYDLADSVTVRSRDTLNWGPAADPGTINVATTIFVATSQEVRVARTNSVALAGGVVGSKLSADLATTTTLLVVNPY